MKILWVADCDLVERPAGGAELTDYFMIQEGLRRGHEIIYVTRREFHKNNLDDYDLIMLSNNYSYSISERKEIMRRNYIVFNHDFQGWKRVCRNHPALFERSLLNIFLSPLHKNEFEKFEKREITNSICVPPHMPEYIEDLKEERVKNSVVYMGNLWTGLKGANLLYSYACIHQELKFHFYYQRSMKYWVNKLNTLSNVFLHGHIEHKYIKEKLNKAEYFIHLPDDIEAFGRAVSEAYLCGCKIIGNNNIGAFSYKWAKVKGYFKQKTKDSPKMFWNKIEKPLKKSII